MSAVSKRRSCVLSQAAALVMESLERRALLSAGSILHTEFTDVAAHSDTGGAVVRVAGQKLLQIGFGFDADFKSVISLARFNSDGTPDGTFGAAGSNVVSNPLPDPAYINGAVNAAAVDPTSGRIIVVGRADTANTSDYFVAAFAPDGQLDGGFSGDGVSFGDFFPGQATEARAVAIGNGGAVFVAGGAMFNLDLFSLARFNSDGTLDDAFANHGIAQTPSLEDVNDGTDSVDIVHAIALDADGNIILAGSSLARFIGEDAPVIALQRYTPLGYLDTSFGTAGSKRFDVAAPAVTALGDKAYSVAVDQLGRIVVGGTTDGPIGSSDEFVLVRFNDHGIEDASFGTGGIARNYFGGFSSALITDIAIQSDGVILAGGNVLTCTDDSCGESSNTFAVARYSESGHLDTTFGTTGVVLTQHFLGARPENNLATLALQSDADGNQFLALGSWLNADFPLDGSPPIHASDDLVVVRFALNGAVVDLAGPAMANEGDTVHFTATFSGAIASGISFFQEQHRAEGTAAPMPHTTVSYSWTITLDGQSTPVASGSGTATDTLDIPFIPGDNGLYHVFISVNGGEDTDDIDITVANVDPTATINNAPESSPEGTPISVGSTVSDAGRDDDFTYAWSVTKNGDAFSLGNAATFSFTPDDNGTYIVTLTVTDDDGGVGTDSKTIDVSNLNPAATINGAPASGSEGTAISLSSTVTDPGTADTFTFAWSVTKNGDAFASGSDVNFAFTPDDNGTYLVTLAATDDDGGVGSDTRTILVTNLNPTATIGDAPASELEGSVISLSGSASDPGSADTLTFSWAVTKNGSAFTTGSGSAFTFTPDDDGSYVVTLTVTDDDGGVGTDSRTIAVANVPPAVDPVFGPATGEQGSALTFTSAFTDPGSADSWTVIWNFGDGTSLTTSGSPGAISATHTYAAAGTYTVSVTVSDDDGGSDSESASITISAASGTTLTIDGTTGDDDIKIKPGEDGTLLVEVNGVHSTYSGITQIIIHAGAGDDKIKVNPEVTQDVVIFAGDGDDKVKTGAGDDIVIGGDGDDLLHGNAGRDLLIGGAGRDRIVGNADSDILVAGYSQHDSNPSALAAILAEWTSPRSYGQRTANVVGGDVVIHGVPYFFGGERANGENFLTPDGIGATVFDDAQVDILTGGSGQDLFLFNSDGPIRDNLSGLNGTEFAADIDFLSDAETGCSTESPC